MLDAETLPVSVTSLESLELERFMLDALIELTKVRNEPYPTIIL